MSARSENYKCQDNRTLSCLHNYYLQNATQFKTFDYNTGYYYARTQPQDLLANNRSYQLYEFGTYDNSKLSFVTNSSFSPPSVGLPSSSYYYFEPIKPWDWFNKFGNINPMRTKTNLRRSYWTGKPRSRRNLKNL